MIGKSEKRLSMKGAGLYTKFVVASFFMFIIPLILIVYAALVVLPKKYFTDSMDYTRFIIFLMMVSGIFGYVLIRKVATNILSLTNSAKKISEGKIDEKIPLTEQDELKDLACAFNRITSELEKKISELEYSRDLTKELFQKIGYAITSAQKLDALLNIIVEVTRKVVKSGACLIALYDKKDNRLRVSAYSGNQSDLSINTELPDDKGAIGIAIKNSKPMMLEKTGFDSISVTDKERLRYNNIACIPIIEKKRTLGILSVTDQDMTTNSKSENLSLLENIANQIAISIGNFELNKNIEETYYETLITLARVIEAKDPYTKGHLDNVAAYVERMGERLKLNDESKKTLKGGAALHDLGKVGISDNILNKNGAFTPEEYEIMKQHAVIGENILKPLRSMEKLSSLVRHHHELYDGSGYPDGLKGDGIPLLSRILTIADMYDALMSDRSYRKAYPKERAIEMIEGYAGNKLDPKLVKTFLEIVREE